MDIQTRDYNKTGMKQGLPSKSEKSMASSHWFLFEVGESLGELEASSLWLLWAVLII